ncbi:peroxiredoxin [Powellomyces hirtus]|uniref:Peroxiredoxin n=1 Tax=Powellomyces hirtus TaxID=109895 RepID=A0A507E1D3_9FUNG|nr:cysteine peroxiredoxin [Powellomyces hirtus]TPX56890.1 peroxiredoxin [Powellomyces hirtus]
MGLRLGDEAPNFKTETTKGEIEFHKWKQGAWTILFSHPEDFTPVCTTELGAVARLAPEWESRNVKVLGLSCNDLRSHGAWISDIQETQACSVDFPIIADADRKVATLYDMLDYQDASNVDRNGMPLTVRSVFIIDTNNKIRLTMTYPAVTGRNFTEILRAVDSLQLGDARRIATPADWTGKGDEVIIHNGVSNEEAAKLFPGFKTVLPYLRTTKLHD